MLVQDANNDNYHSMTLIFIGKFAVSHVLVVYKSVLGSLGLSLFEIGHCTLPCHCPSSSPLCQHNHTNNNLVLLGGRHPPTAGQLLSQQQQLYRHSPAHHNTQKSSSPIFACGMLGPGFKVVAIFPLPFCMAPARRRRRTGSSLPK